MKGFHSVRKLTFRVLSGSDPVEVQLDEVESCIRIRSQGIGSEVYEFRLQDRKRLARFILGETLGRPGVCDDAY